jgi:hypothetical protein
MLGYPCSKLVWKNQITAKRNPVVLCQGFHETQWFFRDFEITATGDGSFDSDFFSKYLVVLSGF